MKKYTLDEVYTADMTAFQRERYNRVADEFEKLFGEKPTAFFSAPGRTEVGGNHTDHNFGCVLAAGVSLDVIAAVAPDTEENVITIKSEGFPMDTVNVDDDTIYEEQKNTSAALIRGMSAGFKKEWSQCRGASRLMLLQTYSKALDFLHLRLMKCLSALSSTVFTTKAMFLLWK